MRATGPSPAHATASTAPRTCLAPTRPPQLRPRPRRRTRAPMTRLLWPNARELPLGETRSRTVTRFSPCPSGDLLRARHAGPARTLATTDSAASARGQPQRRDWQADGPCRPEAVTLSMSTVLSHATTSGQRQPRERRRRQMPAPTRRQGSRRSIQETPYSPLAGDATSSGALDGRAAGSRSDRQATVPFGTAAASRSGSRRGLRRECRS